MLERWARFHVALTQLVRVAFRGSREAGDVSSRVDERLQLRRQSEGAVVRIHVDVDRRRPVRPLRDLVLLQLLGLGDDTPHRHEVVQAAAVYVIRVRLLAAVLSSHREDRRNTRCHVRRVIAARKKASLV